MFAADIYEIMYISRSFENIK